MRNFKLKLGLNEVFEITRINFEKQTLKKSPYRKKMKNNETGYFAVCPACNNPIQLIGLYSSMEHTDHPYGKHYTRSIEGLAEYNAQAYYVCPYASHSYHINPDKRKNKMTQYEKGLYYSLRENFDLCIYVLKKVTGIYISDRTAIQLLQNYLAAEGYMYYWATEYNLPWMLLYFGGEIKIYKRALEHNSPIWEHYMHRRDVVLNQAAMKDYDILIPKDEYIDDVITAILHERKVVDDEVEETLCMVISASKGKAEKKWEHILKINECRFPALVNNAKFRNKPLLEFAYQAMPDLDEI